MPLSGPAGLALGHETIDLIGEHDLSVTPENYEVWLSYRLSRDANLTQAIDHRIAAHLPISQDFVTELHERFFSNARISAHMVAASERIARDLHVVVDALQSSHARTDEYGKTLESAAQHLSGGLDGARLQELISALSAATIDMATHNRGLTDQLQTASREVESLRASLATVRAESLTDGLTGLANRRMFDENLRIRIADARAMKSELCLLMLDVDHFKRFNDTWGHQTGDQILRFIAGAMTHHALPDYLVARYGGEEFAVIMPRTGISAARSIAESLRSAIQGKRLRRRSTNEDLGQVTVSIGVARLAPGETLESFVERCDACLYASKRNGRNQVTSDAEPNLNVA